VGAYFIRKTLHFKYNQCHTNLMCTAHYVQPFGLKAALSQGLARAWLERRSRYFGHQTSKGRAARHPRGPSPHLSCGVVRCVPSPRAASLPCVAPSCGVPAPRRADGSLVIITSRSLVMPSLECPQCEYPHAELLYPCALCGKRACDVCSTEVRWRAQLHLLQRGRRRTVHEGPAPGWSVWLPLRWGHILRGRRRQQCGSEIVWICGLDACRLQFGQVQRNLIFCGIEVNCR